MKWFELNKTLQKSGAGIFTDREFRELLNLTPASAKFILIRYTARGLLKRLKRGLYAAAERMPPSFVIANRLYKPSYISAESALSYYGMIPESTYAVTSITTKPTREFDTGGLSYIYSTVKNCAFTGYRALKISGETIWMAEKEKALADYLYFAFLNKAQLNDRLSLRGAGKSLLSSYVRIFNSPRFEKWFKNDLRIPNP